MTDDGSRHGPGRRPAGPRAPRHEQARQRRRSRAHRELRLPGRGAPGDRVGLALPAPHPRRRGCRGHGALRRSRPRSRGARGRQPAGNSHRGGRSLRRAPRAAQVPEGGVHRVDPRRRLAGAGRAGPARRCTSTCSATTARPGAGRRRETGWRASPRCSPSARPRRCSPPSSSAKACGCAPSSRGPTCTGGARRASTSTSTAGPCATGCSATRCSRPIATGSPAAASRRRSSSSSCPPTRST